MELTALYYRKAFLNQLPERFQGMNDQDGDLSMGTLSLIVIINPIISTVIKPDVNQCVYFRAKENIYDLIIPGYSLLSLSRT